MAAFLLASLLCVAAFVADTPAEDVVLRAGALKRDNTTVVIKDYTVFEDGWNAAIVLLEISICFDFINHAKAVSKGN